MALGTRMEFRQGQSLVLTPQLKQAIKLLQLSNLELNDFLAEEMAKNPLLEVDTPDEIATPEPIESFTEVALGDTHGTTAEAAMDVPTEDVYVDAAPGDMAENGGATGSLVDWSKAGSGKGFDGDDEGAFDRNREQTLAEYIEEQITTAGFSAPDRLIAMMLLDCLDDWGYLRADLEEMAYKLGCPLSSVEAVLIRCQGFDPTGVFARDVKECLSLQLIEKNRFDPAMQALLDNLDLLAKRDMGAMKRVCGVDDEDLRDMIAEVRALSPKPGLGFGASDTTTVVPDVFVRETREGGWHVELNSDTMPRVLVNQRYYATLAGKTKGEDKAYMSECLTAANWLVRSLDQRARTILRVASEIIRQQDAFFAEGVEKLRPLNLKTVADAIGMHESTVSRVTTNKYMATPRGVFEFKYFFTSSIASNDGGEAYSAEAIRHKIKQLIDGEAKPEDVLSDDRIVDILKEAGVEIARRTVAKYREALRIPPSVERKRMLQQAG